MSRIEDRLVTCRSTFLNGSLLMVLVLAAPGTARGQEVDQVTTKDGTVLRGRIVGLADGELRLATPFHDEVKIKWSEVAGLQTAKPIPFVLKDGTSIQGLARPGAEGEILLKAASIPKPLQIKLDQIQAIHPPEKKAVEFKGSLTLGSVVVHGNTRNRSLSFLGAFEAKSERQRLTLNGYSNYGDDGHDVIVRNSRGALKYDFFITKRLYPYAATFFEGDKFQDLTLRSALSTGLGFQIIRVGDFASPLFKGLEFSAEGGVAYFDEDFRRAKDDSYVSGRWAVKLDWPVIQDRLTLFHAHEVYPSFESQHDVYILTQQGLRLNIVKNFIATFQVNYRWDNTPAVVAGKTLRRNDTLVLITLGYSFSF